MSVFKRRVLADRERPDRVIGQRPPLPRGRAVVGGLLIAAAALGVLLFGQATTDQRTSYRLVAASTLQPGHRIHSSDLSRAQLTADDSADRQFFRHESDVVGLIVQHTVAAGEVLLPSSVATAPPAATQRRLSLALAPAQALGGEIAPGDSVDITVTGTDPGTGTNVVATDVPVLNVQRPSGQLGSTDVIIVTVAVPSQDAATTVIDGSQHGTVTLIAPHEGPGQ